MCFNVKKIILSTDFETSKKSVQNDEGPGTDVIVLINEEDDEGDKRDQKYVASFFPFEGVEKLNEKHFKNGDYLNGTYFHAKNMVLINKCTHKNIHKVVEHLIIEGNFIDVFRKL